MSTSFIPKGQEGLLLRNPLTQNHAGPISMYRPKSQHYPQDALSLRDAQMLQDSSVGKRVGFYTRHNPHPVRVRHMKGLLDIPICVVEDNIERRILWSAPSGQDFSVHYRPPGSGRYSANLSKQLPAIGIVPVTYAWRDELERKTQNAIDKLLGQAPPSRQFHDRGRHMPTSDFDHVEDEQLLDLLCRILQTDSVPACQAWLNSASDTEKTIVMNMLRMAATGEIEANISQSRPNTRNSATQCLQRPDKMASSTTFPQDFQQAEDTIAATQLRSTLPFKVPEHDTIIRSAHSRLASSQGNRPGSAFHQTLQQELDQQTERLYSHLRSRSTKGRPRSSSLASRPVSTDLFSQHPLSRGRTYSWTTGLRNEPLLPPPPVKVRVTKKMLNTTPSPSKTQDHYLPQWINSQ